MSVATTTKRQPAPRRRFYPLDSPGIAAPGTDFLLYAAAKLNEQIDLKQVAKDGPAGDLLRMVEALYYRAMTKPGFVMPISLGKNRREPCVFVPGHLWGGRHPVTGPVPAEVMVLGKMPGEEESFELRNLIGGSGKYLIEKLEEQYLLDWPNWYVTNLAKFNVSGTFTKGIINQCLPILHQELRIVRPKYILCLGADAAKELLGRRATVQKMMGRVVELTYPVNAPGEPEETHTSLVMVVKHPASILRFPVDAPELEQGLSRWGLLLGGTRFDDSEPDIDHRVIDDSWDLDDLITEIDATCTDRIVALDAEWHGEHPQNDGAYLRTVQVSWAPKTAACIVIRRQGGALVRQGWEQEALEKLQTCLSTKRVFGHFLNADMERLCYYGLDVREAAGVPGGPAGDVPAWERLYAEGGGDTGLMYHSLHETGSFKLEHLALRYTPAPRYDVRLQEWLEAYCKEHGLKPKNIEGYGDCPDDVLYPYGNYDADVTRRLAILFLQKYGGKDVFGNNVMQSYWVKMRANPAILEMHQTGIQIDRERTDELTVAFLEAREKLETQIREWACWPEFNIRSVFQVREFLFGEEYNGKEWLQGQPVRLRPDEAKTLAVAPLVDTGKRPMLWTEVERKGLERERTPGTGKAVLEVLGRENLEHSEQINWVRDHRYIDQVLKSVLRPPELLDVGTSEEPDEELGYTGGIVPMICGDGRVRTTFYMTLETGRWASARPALQNWSKTRDKDYKRILGEKYEHKIRSILRSTLANMQGAWCNEDTVLIEADYTGAELCGMAWMAGDKRMIEHARRNLLPEDHPDYYDIHSNIAVLAFRLSCPPTKKGLADIEKTHLRTLAKNVIFGIAYGRGAKAIALAARSEGVHITADDAQDVINTIFKMYPRLKPFFAKCRERAEEPRWEVNCFGAYRRAMGPVSDDILGDTEREFMNFPIQSLIASAMNRAVDHLYNFKIMAGVPDMYRMILQIHDAVVLEVPISWIEMVVDHVLPTCMCELVPIYPTLLDGRPTKRGPYYLGVDISVAEHWGEKLTKERALQLGVPLRFAA